MLAWPSTLRSAVMAISPNCRGGHLPDLRIHQLHRDVARVADLREALDDRRELKVAVAGQNAVAVGWPVRGLRRPDRENCT